jgi:hypothetical protein
MPRDVHTKERSRQLAPPKTGVKVRLSRCWRKSRDSCGNDRHNAVSRQFLYEQIPAIGPDRLQRQIKVHRLLLPHEKPEIDSGRGETGP